MRERQRPRRVRCPNCGRMVWSTDHVCMYCGAELKPLSEIGVVGTGTSEGVVSSEGGEQPSAEELLAETRKQIAEQIELRAGMAQRPTRPQEPTAREERKQREGTTRAEPEESSTGPAPPPRKKPRPAPGPSDQLTLFFVRRRGDERMTYGPYDLDDIKEMLERGDLHLDDEASLFPDRGWQPLQQVVARSVQEELAAKLKGPLRVRPRHHHTSQSETAPAATGEGQPPDHGQGAVAREYFLHPSIEGPSGVPGPFDVETLRRMVALGQLSLSDLVSADGSGDWRPVSEVLRRARYRSYLRPRWMVEEQKRARRAQASRTMEGQQAPQGEMHRSPYVAALLAIFFGSFGAHKFYNGSLGWGVTYLIFCYTGLPTMAGFFEGLGYLIAPQNYNKRYNESPPDAWKW
ncbi:MAG: NINE protein [Armatimonadetes bacterium]|nr:NINE protein [Armatimonadota bacterium]